MKATHPTSILAILPSCSEHDTYDITVMKFVLLVKETMHCQRDRGFECFCPNILAVKALIKLPSGCCQAAITKLSSVSQQIDIELSKQAAVS